MSPEELGNQSWGPLCNAYAVSGHNNEEIRAELQRRDDELAELIANDEPDPMTGGEPRQPFTEREWDAIDSGQIFVGMSEQALICSWGIPNSFSGGDVNRTVTASGERRQYVYRATQYASAQYVYVEDGEVVAFQD